MVPRDVFAYIQEGAKHVLKCLILHIRANSMPGCGVDNCTSVLIFVGVLVAPVVIFIIPYAIIRLHRRRMQRRRLLGPVQV